MTIQQLYRDLAELDAELAPGSETPLWGGVVARLHDLARRAGWPGCVAGHRLADCTAPVGQREAEWWMAAYRYYAANPDATTDEVYDAADDVALTRLA